MAGIGQPRTYSFIEAVVNTSVGFLINLGGQMVLYPLIGIHITLATNLIMSIFFTVISVVLGYTLRRAFNWWHVWYYMKR